MNRNTIYCWKCGNKISNKMHFCPNCGAKTEFYRSQTDQYTENLNRINNDNSNLDNKHKSLSRKRNYSGYKLELVLSKTIFRDFLKWFIKNIYLTILTFITLMIIVTLAPTLGWLLLIVYLITIYLFISNRKIYSTSLEKNIRYSNKQGISSFVRSFLITFKEIDFQNSRNLEFYDFKRVLYIFSSAIIISTTFFDNFLKIKVSKYWVNDGNLVNILKSSSDISGKTSFLIICLISIGPILGIVFAVRKNYLLMTISTLFTMLSYLYLFLNIIHKLNNYYQIAGSATLSIIFILVLFVTNMFMIGVSDKS